MITFFETMKTEAEMKLRMAEDLLKSSKKDRMDRADIVRVERLVAGYRDHIKEIERAIKDCNTDQIVS